MLNAIKSILLIGGLLLSVTGSSAQNLSQVIKIVESDRENPANRVANDYFGYSVAINGNYAIVGAYQEDQDVNGANTLDNAGAAYIFVKVGSSWGFQQKIVAADRKANSFFGSSVAIDGNIAVVGAYQESYDANNVGPSSGAGAAYVFSLTGTAWAQQQKLAALDRESGDGFGFSLAVNGNYIIIGAYQESIPYNAAGAAYIYNYNGTAWVQQQKLVSADRHDYDFFGYSVSLSGAYAVVGAYGNDYSPAGTDYSNGAGAAYIFSRTGSTWTQQQKTVALDRADGNNFGWSVAISGDNFVVGCPLQSGDGNGTNNLLFAGAVYVYSRSGASWYQQQKLVAGDRAAFDHFGNSVAMDGGNIIVGSNHDGQTSSNSLDYIGSAYLFKAEGVLWGQGQKLAASDGAAGDAFGTSVSISGNWVVAGAPYNSGDAAGGNPLTGSGSIYIFGPSSSVLPIGLLSFQAAKNSNGAIRIEWQTGPEPAGVAYEVERAADGVSFGTIDMLKGDGRAYSHTLYDTKPLPRINYYRLKIIEPASFSYSPICSVDYGDEKITIYPNPATSTLTIQTLSNDQLGKEALVFDAHGRTVAKIVLASISVVNISQWESGPYIISFPSGKGLKFMKQ